MVNTLIFPLLVLLAVLVVLALSWQRLRSTVTAVVSQLHELRARLQPSPATRLYRLTGRLLNDVLDQADHLLRGRVLPTRVLLILNPDDPLLPLLERNLHPVEQDLNEAARRMATVEDDTYNGFMSLVVLTSLSQPVGKHTVECQYGQVRAVPGRTAQAPAADRGASVQSAVLLDLEGASAQDCDDTPPIITPVLVTDRMQRYDVTKHPQTVGRARDCEIVVSDPLASKRHLILVQALDNGVKVVDLNSTNGTRIHGTRIKDVVVYEDTELLIAQNTRLRILFEGQR